MIRTLQIGDRTNRCQVLPGFINSDAETRNVFTTLFPVQLHEWRIYIIL
jgi:hypothetical protein